jgi:hypothetical protein
MKQTKVLKISSVLKKKMKEELLKEKLKRVRMLKKAVVTY